MIVMLNEELKEILGKEIISFYFECKDRIENIDKMIYELTGV